MKILLTGGGSGGHFYPLMAVAEDLRTKASEEKIADLDLFYMADTPYNEKELFEHNISFIEHSVRPPKGLSNPLLYIGYLFQLAGSVITAIPKVYKLFPDAVFSKGGYPAVPVVVAAWLLRIPVIIHESDTIPGRVSKMTSKMATRVAVSFQEAYDYFPASKTAFVGHLVRPSVREPLEKGAYEYFGLNPTLRTIAVFGGSQGAQEINGAVLDALTLLIEDFQIIHQAGAKNFKEVKSLAEVTLKDNKYRDRYKVVPYLNTLGIRMTAGIADLVIARSGSGHISEVSQWGIPSIMVPLKTSHDNHQHFNAFAYARTGACSVLEVDNLSGDIILSEVKRIMDDTALYEQMKEATKEFRYPDAARTIAEELLRLGTHKK